MKPVWAEAAWEDYLHGQTHDKTLLKGINRLAAKVADDEIRIALSRHHND